MAPSRATYLDLHDETLVYFFRLVAVFEQIVRIPTRTNVLMMR